MGCVFSQESDSPRDRRHHHRKHHYNQHQQQQHHHHYHQNSQRSTVFAPAPPNAKPPLKSPQHKATPTSTANISPKNHGATPTLKSSPNKNPEKEEDIHFRRQHFDRNSVLRHSKKRTKKSQLGAQSPNKSQNASTNQTPSKDPNSPNKSMENDPNIARNDANVTTVTVLSPESNPAVTPTVGNVTIKTNASTSLATKSLSTFSQKSLDTSSSSTTFNANSSRYTTSHSPIGNGESATNGATEVKIEVKKEEVEVTRPRAKTPAEIIREHTENNKLAMPQSSNGNNSSRLSNSFEAAPEVNLRENRATRSRSRSRSRGAGEPSPSSIAKNKEVILNDEDCGRLI